MGLFIFTIRRLLFAFAAWLCFISPSPGQNTYPQDLYQTYQARQALFNESILETLNLGVRVHDGRAVLWGPVPTSLQSSRAEHLLRDLPFINEVINELEIEQTESGKQWVPAAEIPFLPISEPQFEDTPPVRPPGVVKKPDTNAIVPTTGWVPAVGDTREPKEVEPRPALTLHTPIPAATVSTAKPAPLNLKKSLNALLAQHTQFRGLTVQESDGVVYIRGPHSTAPAMYELARRVARLPEVARVVVQPQ